MPVFYKRGYTPPERNKQSAKEKTVRLFQKIRPFIPHLSALLFGAGLLLVMTRHEMWRDEIQAWLLARDSQTVFSLMQNIKYEGHPGLWHLVLWPVTHISWNPVLMQVLHAGIAACSVYVLYRHSPFSWPVKIVLSLGYFFAYEWGVISRNYALSVFLFFTFAACFKNRWKNFLILSLLLFLTCHTNIHSIVITAVFFVSLCVEYAVAYAGVLRKARKSVYRALGGFLIVAAGLYTGIRQVAPPEDTGFATRWHFKWSEKRAERIAGVVVNGYLPLPLNRPRFWGSNTLLRKPDKNKPDVTGDFWIKPDKRIKYALWIIGLGCLFFLKVPWLAVPYLFSTFGLLSFFYVKYPGSYRHHGFLFLVFVILLWMSYYYRPWKLKQRWLDRLPDFIHRHRMKAAVLIFAVHVCGTYRAVKHDWQTTFSNGRRTALYLNEKFPEHDKFIFVGDRSPHVSTVVGYMQLEKIFYPDRNEFGSYLIWDRKRTSYRRKQLKKRLLGLLEKEKHDAVIILHREAGKKEFPASVRLVNKFGFDTAPIASERYAVYLWPEKEEK